MNRLLPIALCLCLWIASWAIAPQALALTQISVSEVSYHECPAEVGEGAIASGSSMAATCYIVTGITNNTSGKTVFDGDIFGRIYDANGDSVMQNRTRLGGVPEILPGKHPFEIRISVPSNQPTPLKLEQFKASGFSQQVRR
jgi:hypothetical protein